MSALSDLLADEHAAVYAYGVLGARLPEVDRALARAGSVAHKAARDDLVARLGPDAEGPAPSYAVTAPTRAAALALAVRVETNLGVRWRDLVVQAPETELRQLGVRQLSACAVRAAQWRRLAGLPPTVPLPGEA